MNRTFPHGETFVHWLFITILSLAALLSCVVAAASGAEPVSAQTSASAGSDDERQLLAAIQAYQAAYDRGDAPAVAALFSDDARWIADDGRRVEGRGAIQTALATIFTESPGKRLELAPPAIRFLTPDVALEEGSARVTAADGTSETSAYTALHVRRDGRWRLDEVREQAAPAGDRSADASQGPADPLAGLAWMVGDWIDEAADSTVENRVGWSLNRRFLVGHFSATFPGAEPLVGTQVIGYDAAGGTIRSWLFDADGTIGEGVWTHDGRQWIVKLTQVLADGRRASATNVYAPRDADHYAWKSIGRQVDGQFLPNIDEVLVVRKAAQAPAIPAAATPPAAAGGAAN